MTRHLKTLSPLLVLMPLALAALVSCAGPTMPENSTAGLIGTQEVPPVNTSAMGSAQITVHPDHSVTGRVTTAGINATSAHIHEAPSGVNGPVIIPLTKSADNSFVVPPGAKLTDAQYQSYRAGNLYINVHSASNPAGEIRAQLSPGSSSQQAPTGYGY